jgi:hypothetical protein
MLFNVGLYECRSISKTIDTKKVTFIADQNKGFGQRRKAAIFET